MSWKNEADYEYTKNHSLKGWAWEFIRRNEEYKKEWKFFFDKAILTKTESGNTNTIIGIGGSMFIQPTKPDNENYLIPSNFYNKWYLKYFIYPTKTSIADDDFLSVPVSFVNNENEFSNINSFGNLLDVESYFRKGIIPPRSLLALFDLRFPIKKQLKAIEEELVLYQKSIIKRGGEVKKKGSVNVTKANIKTWSLYLRILDAEAEGIKSKVSAPIIFQNVHKNDGHLNAYKESKRQANYMIEEGYKYLI